MVVQQGDVVWVDLPDPDDSSSGGRHPAVVLQHDRFNRTALNTVVVAMLTSQLRYEAQPGNVRLRKGEAGLPKASVVNVTQIATLDRANPSGKIGCLSRERLVEIWQACAWCWSLDEPSARMRRLREPRDHRQAAAR